MTIQTIECEATYPLRRKILRGGDPSLSVQFPEDSLESAFHLGAFDDGQCIGILTAFLAQEPQYAMPNSWQLRGMAVDHDTQRKGVGKNLVLTLFDRLSKQKARLLWCNARETAVGFYQKLGFHITSERFHVPDVGPHYRMRYELVAKVTSH